jgi:hypothetical protein
MMDMIMASIAEAIMGIIEYSYYDIFKAGFAQLQKGFL